MNSNRDPVIIAYGRSPLSRAYKGALANMHPVNYGAQTLRGVLNKLGDFDESCIDDVIVGCAMPENYLGYNVGRLIAQCAGLPDSVAGETVNRFCSSGLQAIAHGANAIKAGEMDVVIAGGVERMTGMDMVFPEEYRCSELMSKNKNSYITMGMTAENVSEKYNVSREDQEIMAVESHRKAYTATKRGMFSEDIIPIMIESDGKKSQYLDYDDGIRSEASLKSLKTLSPCFKKNGVVTPATSSQMTDGASFVVLMSRECAEKLGYKPIAKLLTYAVCGVPADIMGIGPIFAIPKALRKANLNKEEIDLIELNEAFASQALACIRELELNPEIVNVNGGAMALGHPLGATGTILTCKLISELKRRKGKYGLVSMCIGGGMGAAGIFEMEQE